MRKGFLSVIVILVVLTTAMILTGCGQQQVSQHDSSERNQFGDQEEQNECSITVPDPEPEDLSALAQITVDQAVDAALAEYPDATVAEVELDNEDGCLVYSVELNNGKELKIDAGNGQILSVEADDGDDEDDEGDEDGDGDEEDPGYDCSITVPDPEPGDLSSLALITADQAMEIALAAYPDATVEEVDLDNENGCLVYSVELSNDLELKIDAGNGEILAIESDDDDPGGDD